MLGRAFQDDPVSASWLPDPQERARRQRGFLKVFFDEHGHGACTPLRTAMAWHCG